MTIFSFRTSSHDFSYLTQALERDNSLLDLHFFDKKTYRQAKSLLSAIVRKIEAAGKVDEIIEEVAGNYRFYADLNTRPNILKHFGSDGDRLLSLCDKKIECCQYLMLSALLNSKKKKEDIKVFTLQQIQASMPQRHMKYGQQILILSMKLLLEQDLLPLAIALESGEMQTGTSSDELQKVKIVQNVLHKVTLCLNEAIVTLNLPRLPTLNLLNVFKDFKEPNMFSALSEAEESHTSTYGWIIGGLLGLVFLVTIFLGRFIV